MRVRLIILTLLIASIMSGNAGLYGENTRILAFDTRDRVVYVYDPDTNILATEFVGYSSFNELDYISLACSSSFGEIIADKWRRNSSDFYKFHILFREEYAHKFYEIYQEIAWRENV